MNFERRGFDKGYLCDLCWTEFPILDLVSIPRLFFPPPIPSNFACEQGNSNDNIRQRNLNRHRNVRGVNNENQSPPLKNIP